MHMCKLVDARTAAHAAAVQWPEHTMLIVRTTAIACTHLLAHAIHELGPSNPLGETREVLHLSSAHQLPTLAILEALEYHWLQISTSAVDSSGVASRTGSHNDDILGLDSCHGRTQVDDGSSLMQSCPANVVASGVLSAHVLLPSP